MTIPTHFFFDPTFQNLMLQQVLDNQTVTLLKEGLPPMQDSYFCTKPFPQTETGRS